MQATLQTFRPTADKIFVTDLERGITQTPGGIILTDDVGTDKGIRARWGRVLLTGPEVEEVQEGDWVLVQHGRWSTGFDLIDENTGEQVRLWHIENKSMMLATDKDPRLQTVKF